MTYRQAIIFDMDGLMVDSEPLARQAWEQILQAHGYQMTNDVYRQMIGLRIDQSIQIVLDNYPLPITASELIAQKADIFHAIRAQGIPAMPGLMALQAAIKQRGIPWAVATSSPCNHAEIILEQLGLIEDCHAIAAGNEVANGKPSPDIYLLAAERLGIDPTICLALEDSEPGCRAAKVAGMKVVAIPNGETKTAVFSCAHTRYSSLQQAADNLEILLAD
ncbi:MAG: HAD-IA family hydrolase [Aquificales bacterium]|nr:HAD-IA family hydrolase [Aquificales bacterium]